MRVIGVIDVAAGRALHARGGRRDSYRPVRQIAGRMMPSGDPLALARGYIEECGVAELYVADLDAISGRPPQDSLVAALAALGSPLWVDRGVSSVEGALRACHVGASHVIVGLETLPSEAVFGEICCDVGIGAVAFGLDLRDGIPISTVAGFARGCSAEDVAARAAASGAAAIVVVDVARAGTKRGPDVDLLRRVRAAAAGVTLLAGGGVRDGDDLSALRDAGCDGALVATALLEGRLRPGQPADGAHGNLTR